MKAVRIWALAGLLLAAAPAAAQAPVTVQLDAGRVTLSARNVPLGLILNEWARATGAIVLNADRLAAPPVTIEFVGVPERQALEILLRNVPGYVLRPRLQGAAGASAFDRILLLPTSMGPETVTSGSPSAAVASAAPRVVPLPPFLARRPELGVEGPRQPRPDGARPGGAGIFGPGFRERPPVPPAAVPLPPAAGSMPGDVASPVAAPMGSVAAPTKPAGATSIPGMVPPTRQP